MKTIHNDYGYGVPPNPHRCVYFSKRNRRGILGFKLWGPDMGFTCG